MATETYLKKLYTIDEFMALPDAEDGSRYELVEGEIEEMPPAGEDHNLIEGSLYAHLWNFLRDTKLGRVYSGDAGFVFGERTVRAPDVAFVSAARRSTRTRKAVPIVPDFVAEVMSPSDRRTKVDKKVRSYLASGVKLIWVIDPAKKEVFIYRADKIGYDKLTLVDELDGEDVIPGFKLKVSDLFE